MIMNLGDNGDVPLHSTQHDDSGPPPAGRRRQAAPKRSETLNHQRAASAARERWHFSISPCATTYTRGECLRAVHCMYDSTHDCMVAWRFVFICVTGCQRVAL